jgi:2-methylisocitrate lyase-like PEP mutase family enzyme
MALEDCHAKGQPLLVPGAFDGLTARLVEKAGFSAVYMTGFGAAASLLGLPDVGLLSGTEMKEQAARLSAATELPVIADADTGYGNALNVMRTVVEYEKAGVAAVQLEDQVTPKKCGHMAGKVVVPIEEMVSKIRAAVDARRDPDTIIIARTDAVATDGLPAAIERARIYRESGADILFVEAPSAESDVERIAGELAGSMPLLFNWADGGRTPRISYDRIAELGFAMVIYPIGTLLAATGAVQRLLNELRLSGTPATVSRDLQTFAEFTDVVDLPKVEELARKYNPERLRDASW